MLGVVKVLESFVRANDNGMYGRLAFFMTTVTEELCTELEDLDEIQTRVFMFQIGQVISWIGHGDNSQLPDTVREFAEMVQPTAGENGSPSQGASSPTEFDSESG